VGGPACPDATACGGDVLGTWEVNSSCLDVRGRLDIHTIGLGCTTADIAGALEVRGQVEFFDDGRFLDETTTVGDVAMRLAPECLEISGTPVTCEAIGGPLTSLGFSSVGCLDAPNGDCLCGGQVNQMGGMAQITPEAALNGEYSAIDETLTLTSASPLSYSYCVRDETLLVTPAVHSGIQTTHGTVELDRRSLVLR
jgi:hypothetical protein